MAPLYEKRIPRSGEHAFTLIELLVVIAIIAILAIVVVLTLNPAQLLAQSRDANRVSDMATLNSALNLYSTDQAGSPSFSMGTSSQNTTSFVSLSVYDPTATSSQGTNCGGLGLPAQGTSSYPYDCAASSSYRMINSEGWIPVNFSSISGGSPLGALPIDPINQTSSNLYYTYSTNGSQYTVSAFMESSKYAKQMESSGGIDPALLQNGSGINSLPSLGRGLVSYWPLDEGTGTIAYDWSGDGNNGSWTGTPTGTNGYYSPGHVWPWGGAFDGASTYVSSTFTSALTGNFTIMAWIDPTLATTSGGTIFSERSVNSSYGGPGLLMETTGSLTTLRISDPCIGNGPYATVPLTSNAWQHVGMTFNASSDAVNFYINGASAGSGTFNETFATTTTAMHIGNQICWNGSSGGYFQGLIDDVRVYNRVLSAAEVQELYSAEK
jgi:prepilin-type N-terminal cleavage/methylation domain-containing protein